MAIERNIFELNSNFCVCAGLDALNRTGLSSYIPGIPGMGGDAGGGGGYPPPQPDAAPYVPPAAPGYPGGGGGGGPGYSMGGGGGQFPSFPAPGQPMRNIFNESQVKRFKDQVRGKRAGKD